MAVIRTFTRDEIDAIRCYCEGKLRDLVAMVAVAERDHGACIVVLVELMDGYRLAVAAEADGHADRDAGKHMVDDLRRRMTARQQAMH